MPILPVPYIGQWGTTANRFRTDCGVACIAMCLEYYGIRGNLTVDALASETPLASQDNGLPTASLVNLACRHGLRAHASRGVALDDLRHEIDALRPVVALISYGYITGRLDQNYIGLHYVVVVGYDDTHFVCNDPDFWQPYTERGHDILIPVAELDAAMAVCGSQAVLMEQPMTEQVIELEPGQQIVIKAKAAAPLPGVEMVTTAALNVRAAPVDGAVIATLLRGDVVRVIDATPAPWKQLVTGPYTGRYVSGAYLLPKG